MRFFFSSDKTCDIPVVESRHGRYPRLDHRRKTTPGTQEVHEPKHGTGRNCGLDEAEADVVVHLVDE